MPVCCWACREARPLVQPGGHAFEGKLTSNRTAMARWLGSAGAQSRITAMIAWNTAPCLPGSCIRAGPRVRGSCLWVKHNIFAWLRLKRWKSHTISLRPQCRPHAEQPTLCSSVCSAVLSVRPPSDVGMRAFEACCGKSQRPATRPCAP